MEIFQSCKSPFTI